MDIAGKQEVRQPEEEFLRNPGTVNPGGRITFQCLNRLGERTTGRGDSRFEGDADCADRTAKKEMNIY